MYYKAEAYVASEDAGKILYENGITPVYVSDNPVLNAQHVKWEAAKAYRNGLPYHIALAGVTSASAELLGLGERIGKVKPGYDADIVVWDSDPLSTGAAPIQVWIDGTPQFENPVELQKPASKPLHLSNVATTSTKQSEHTNIIMSGIVKIMLPRQEHIFDGIDRANVVICDGKIVCTGTCNIEIATARSQGIETMHLEYGHIIPPATAFASSLGLSEIQAEPDTNDGENSETSFSRAIDGLAFDTKQLRTAYSRGVTKAITAPAFKYGGAKGVSAGFLTGASHALEKGAVWADEVALQYTLTQTEKNPALSSHVGLLRSAMLKSFDTNETTASPEEIYLKHAALGKLPLAITVHSADIIASLLRLKADVEASSPSKQLIRLIIIGGAESHLLAPQLAASNTSVLLAPLLPYSESWDQRRSLTGAPLTNGTAIDILHAAGVKVAIGTKEDWETRDLFLSAGIALANGGGKITEKEALSFVNSNIYDMLGLKQSMDGTEFVVFEGSPLGIQGRVRAIADGRGSVTVFGQGAER